MLWFCTHDNPEAAKEAFALSEGNSVGTLLLENTT